MKRLLRKFAGGREDAQVMIFSAIIFSFLLTVMGLAIEGGRVYTEYRRLQSAADMSALVGAQKLPCGTADATCQMTARTQACNTASANGFNSASSATCSANVPPASCSPYKAIGYGNVSNLSCTAQNSPQFYDYVEVSLTKNLGTIPIFNIPVTLGSHAIAKNGLQGVADFAMVQTDPNGCINMGGNADVNIGGAVYANGCISTIGNHNRYVCNGAWLSTLTQSGAGNLVTDNTGSIVYAPSSDTRAAECTNPVDATYDDVSGLPKFGDPYCPNSASTATCTTLPPQGAITSISGAPTGTYANCKQCTNYGAWRTLPGGTWKLASSALPSGCGSGCEMFPGIYPGSFGLGNGDWVYMNPGVYTFVGGISTNHGSFCMWGAPACQNHTTFSGASKSCGQDPFGGAGTNADIWYHDCSPYGFWDTAGATAAKIALGAGFDSTAPTFLDVSGGYPGSVTTVPLNGVSLVVSSLSFTGNQSVAYIAAPNPCAGTGTATSTSVTWQHSPDDGVSGGPDGTTFAFGSLSSTFGANSPASGFIYPSVDFGLLGECARSKNLVVWPHEMPSPQHLHFVVWDNGGGTLTGASDQNFFGIIYNTTGTVTVTGAGKSLGGPPWITGQLVSASIASTGNSAVDIQYRPCGPGSTACGSGHGTELIQ